VRSKFSCVHSSHDLCARAHAHSLEGTLVTCLLTYICGLVTNPGGLSGHGPLVPSIDFGYRLWLPPMKK